MSERELCIYYTTQTYVFSDRVCVGNTEVAETLRIVRFRLRSRNDSLILQDERHSDSDTAINRQILKIYLIHAIHCKFGIIFSIYR